MRIAAIDLETTDLKANMGTILCASFQQVMPPIRKLMEATDIAVPNPPTYTLKIDLDTMDPHDPNPDKELCMAIRDEIEWYDLVLSWNGVMFDASFLNARLLYHKERPTRFQFHKDLMYYAGQGHNRIGSRRLESVQQFMGIEEQKTRLDWDVWKRAMRGDKAGLDEVVRHCEIDVRVLAEAYWRLLPYVRNFHKAG